MLESYKTGQLTMTTNAKQCFRPSASSLVLLLVVFASATSSQAEVNAQTRPNEDPPYFFYQQSTHPRDCSEVVGRCSTNSSGVYAIKPDGYPEVFDAYCYSDGYTVNAQTRPNEDPPYFFYEQSTHPRDCSEVVGRCSTNSSGVYAIKPDGYPEVFDAYCYSDGYTLILRREQGLVSFNRTWEDYAAGFGFLAHGFWLGNRRLSYLTNQKSYQLRIDVTLSDSSAFYVTYDEFRISEAHSSYRVISTGQHIATIVTCPDNMVPGTCACQQSCADPDDCTTSNCHVTGSCVCPNGFLMSDGYCIPKNQCGCYMAEMENGQGAVLQEGGEYVSRNCDKRCSCTSGKLTCEDDFRCSPHASCEQISNGWNCSCNEGYEGDGVQCSPRIKSDCQDIYDNGQRESGQYSINPTWSRTPIQVYCNMADGGGWTGDYELRIDLTDNSGTNYHADYSLFRVGDEASKYTLLSVGTYSGNTGADRLTWHVNRKFSTRDQDNDGWDDFDCAEQHRGGWWFGYIYRYSNTNYCRNYEYYCDYFPDGSGCALCAYSHLNADYDSTTRGRNIFWSYLYGYDCGLQYTEMRIRPVRS